MWLSCHNVYSFDLFDKDRGKPPVVVKPAPPPVIPPLPLAKPTPSAPVAPPQPPPPQRDFVLQGTARFGERWLAVLQTSEGQPIIQEWSQEKPTPLKDFPDYKVVKIEARKVVLAYPPNSLCRNSNVQKGIQCQDNGKTAALSLQWRDAINAPSPPPQPQVMPPQQIPQPAGQPPLPGQMPPQPGMGQPPSPEDLARQEEDKRKRQEMYKNFRRQTIEDKDVPPGMRVIRTPFGDRLVPDNRPQ